MTLNLPYLNTGAWNRKPRLRNFCSWGLSSRRATPADPARFSPPPPPPYSPLLVLLVLAQSRLTLRSIGGSLACTAGPYTYGNLKRRYTLTSTDSYRYSTPLKT